MSTLPIVNFNRYMQQQSPILYVLYQELDDLIRKFLLRFMNSDYVCAAEQLRRISLVTRSFHESQHTIIP